MSGTEMEYLKDSHEEVVGYYFEIVNGKEITFEVNKGDQMPEIVRQDAENRFPNTNLSNNEIDPMQYVDTNEDIISEDEGICQVEGNNVETNETIQCKKHNDTKLHKVKAGKGLRTPQPDIETNPLDESDLVELPNIIERETLDNLHEIDSRTNAHTYAFTLQEYFNYKQNTKNQVEVKNGIRIPQSKIKPPKEYLLDDITDFSYESDSSETEENPTDSRTFENNFSHKINNYNQVNIRKGLSIPEHETERNLECLLDESGLELPNITESGTLENLQESDSTETEENLTDSRTNEQFTLKDNFNYEINTNNQVKVKKGIRIPQLEVGTDPGYLLDESDQGKLPIITQRKTLDNLHESDCISGEIFSQGKESNQISKEDFLNNLVVKFVQRYVNEERAKGFKISTNESTDENASSADEGLVDMEEDFVNKINEYLENFVDGTEFNNEINTMQCVDTNKDIISEDEGICQMDGNNVETNETIQGILQSSEENYIYKKNEKNIYIIGKEGCPNVGKVPVHQISADTNNYITKDYIIKENEQDLCLITEGKEKGEEPDEENLLPSVCLLVEQNNEKSKMDTGDFVDENTFRTDKMEIDEKHVEEIYVQENLPVVIQVVEGKERIYSILYKSPWEIAYLNGEEINISKVLSVKLSKERGTKKLQHFKAFILTQKDTSSKEQEKVYNITKFVKLSKKQEKISACKANEAKIKMNKKSKKKNMLRTMKKLLSSSANKNKLKIKRLPKRKFLNVADYFIEEQISKLCFDSHRAEKLEYIYEQEYNPEDYEYPKANKIKCVWHKNKIEKKNFVGKSDNTYDKIRNHFNPRKGRMAKAASQSEEIEIVVPVREKVVPLKNPKKLSVLKQVLEDLKKEGLLKKHGISDDVFIDEISLPTKDENVKKKNNKRKVASTNEPRLEKRKKEVTNSDNLSNQNLSLMHKLMNIINKVKEENCSTKRTKESKNKKQESKERNKRGSIKSRKNQPYYSLICIKKIDDQSFQIIHKYNMEEPNKQTTAKHPTKRKDIKKAKQGEVIKHIGSGQQAKTAVKGTKKEKVVKEATEREEAIQKIDIGQQSEQLKTTANSAKKRKAGEKTKEREDVQKKMRIWQQSKQPKTTANSPKKRKADVEAKERENLKRMSERQFLINQNKGERK